MTPLIRTYRVAVKRGAVVEVDRQASHQHEFNGTAALRSLFGEQLRERFPSVWLLLRDDVPPVVEEHQLTWYDARANHPERTEWRLYYDGDPSIDPGDVVAILMRGGDDATSILVAAAGSTWAQQLTSLFGDPITPAGVFVEGHLDSVPDVYVAVAQELFDAIGWAEQAIEPARDDLAVLHAKFGAGFPTTREFSTFARVLEPNDPADPDGTLFRWWRREEALFRALEESELAARLDRAPPFQGVEDFLSFSLSVQNRRKSRAGHALENHVEELLKSRGLRHARGIRTEGQRRPDFILPGEVEYQDPSFPEGLLTMLAAKTSCKDRWRQVLSEAARIKRKHLITLEPAISPDQLTEMRDESLTLVVPARLKSTYKPPTGMELKTLAEFLNAAEEKQRQLPPGRA